MNATLTATSPTSLPVAEARPGAIAALRAVLLIEASLALVATIFLSLLASALASFLGGAAGREAEETVRFAASAVFVFGLAAAVTARGVRRTRRWSWTSAALLQLALAGGAALALAVTAWTAASVTGFALAVVSLLLLSMPSVRRALGQE